MIIPILQREVFLQIGLGNVHHLPGKVYAPLSALEDLLIDIGAYDAEGEVIELLAQKLAEDDAARAGEAYNKLKEEDPDSANTLAAQEKAETASLLVEKIRDNIDQDQKMR
jgi:hypothetical protein